MQVRLAGEVVGYGVRGAAEEGVVAMAAEDAQVEEEEQMEARDTREPERKLQT